MNHNQQDIDEHLLLQYLQGNADEALIAGVVAWLNADGGNRKHLDQLESLWLETGRISPAPVEVDVDKAWERINQRISKEEVQDFKMRKLWISRILWTAAASVLFIAGIFGVLKLTESPKQLRLASFDHVLSDSLSDGSKITLNRNSTLGYPARFDDKVREVKLTGEAYFEVKHDSQKPFIVDAGMAKIRVLGTVFRVYIHSDKAVEVNVTEGRVMLFTVDVRSGDTSSLILRNGESGILRERARIPVMIDSTSADVLFWANRSLDFRRMPLARVFNLLEKHYQMKITVSDSSILFCRLTASFADEPVNRILSVIAESFGLEMEIKGQNVQFTGDGCSKGGD